jgi:hypothetical protein
MARVPEPARPRDLHEFHDDLKATLAARREISPEMEDALIANFLQQVERRIDARVDARVNEVAKFRQKQSQANTGLVAATLALSIPLVVLAGVFGQAVGIVAVVTLIFLINILYAFKQ